MKLFQKLLTVIFVSLFSVAVFATNNTPATSSQPTPANNNKPTPAAAPTPILIPAPPNINAKSYVIMDANSGKIIASNNAHEKRPPASLTKLMTLYLISDALAHGQIKLTDKVRISRDAWSTGGSRMFLKLGSHVPVQDLIEGIIVTSGNDATVAMADYIGGNQSSFVNLMDETAQQLGMTHTHYTDPTGLPHPDHYSCAYDIAILTRAIIEDFPEDYKWYKQKWIKWNGIRQANRNRLLWRDPYVDGMKTGHTKAAGYCLVASAEKNGMRLITVVMGAPTDSARMNDSQSLLNYGFRFYETHKLYAAQATLDTPRVWMGKNKTVPMGVAKDLYVTIPRGTYGKLKAKMALDKQLRAPIEKDQSYGKVIISLNGKEIVSTPLIALDSDPEGGFFDRFRDHISMFFQHWFKKA